MRGKSIALLVLALGCGLVASLGITQVLAKRGEPAPQGDMATVYIAKVDISPGALATSDNVKPEQWPKDKVPAGSLVRQEDVDGRRVKFKIFSGQPILEPMLLARGEMSINDQIPKGLRVIAIPVGIEAIQGGLVLPGSRCDLQVFIRADASLGVGETLSKTILQDIRVFAVNDVTVSNESSDPKTPEARSIPSARTVSLLVTPAQAEIVTLASQLGTIRLILRSAEDTEQFKGSTMTAHELLGAYGGANRGLENPESEFQKRFANWAGMIREALKSSAHATGQGKVGDEPARFTVRVRNGGACTDVLLIANASPNAFPTDDATWTATNLPSRTTTGSDNRTPTTIDTTPTPATAESPSAGTKAPAIQPVLPKAATRTAN